MSACSFSRRLIGALAAGSAALRTGACALFGSATGSSSESESELLGRSPAWAGLLLLPAWAAALRSFRARAISSAVLGAPERASAAAEAAGWEGLEIEVLAREALRFWTAGSPSLSESEIGGSWPARERGSSSSLFSSEDSSSDEESSGLRFFLVALPSASRGVRSREKLRTGGEGSQRSV